MKLFVLRHGETDENVSGIVQGWQDTELSPRGHSQAKQAAESFGEKIDAIYTSDLKRSAQTAIYFRHKFSEVPYYEDARLRERFYGDVQGTQKDPSQWEEFWSQCDILPIPGAETPEEYTKRVARFLDTLRSLYDDDKSVLVVAHGGTINRILDVTNTKKLHAVANCEYIEVHLYQGEHTRP